MAEQDLYASQYATSILLEKRARKLAEEDALRLYNRVRQLEKEEDKAHKRIVDTKRKAKEIIKLRERNELVRQEKEQRVKEMQLEVEQQKQQNLRLKDEIARNKTEQENKVWADKYTVAQQTKEERAECERLLAETRVLARKDAVEQKELVRKAQDEARRRIEQLKLDKLQMAQEEYEKRLKEEMEAKAAKEAEIERLAQVELQLIERLKLKQHEQRKAYQQLEAVLSLGGVGSGTCAPGARKTCSPSKGSAPQQQQPAAAQPIEPTEEDVARAFSIYDDDAVGQIPTTSLGALIRDLGVPLTAAQLAQAIAQLDVAQAGVVSFGDFLLWWKG